MKRPVVLGALAFALSCSSNNKLRCDPRLYLTTNDGVALGEGGASAGSTGAMTSGTASGGPTAPKEGDVVIINFDLPEGVDSESDVAFRVQTPCSCATFSRKPVDLESVESLGACTFGSRIRIPLVLPRGGACRLTVSASVNNTSAQAEMRGPISQCNLDCTSDVLCDADLDGTTVGSGTSSATSTNSTSSATTATGSGTSTGSSI